MRRTFRSLEMLLDGFPVDVEIDHDGRKKYLFPPELIDLDARKRIVTRKRLRSTKRRPFLWMFRTPLAALIRVVVAGSDVMAEAHRMGRDAARRYPHINFDA
jgi:hypothetical protein